MGQNSTIEWTDHTCNLWWGCSKVHTGCKNCYAEYLSETRYSNGVWGEKSPRKRIKSAFANLLKWQREAKFEGIKLRVFCGSMMDIFEDSKELSNPTREYKTTSDLRSELFANISNGMYPDLVFLMLTKRPRNIAKMIPGSWSHGIENVWFGTSISDAATCKNAEQLTNSLKAQNLFLSIEPQVGEIALGDLNLKGIDWVIQGGESGHGRRPFNLHWALQMREICDLYGVPYFFKQIDKKQEIPHNLLIRELPSF